MSGAHLSPGITIAATLFKGFPPLKALRYIVAQILGGFVACLVVYVQYHDQIKALTTALEAEGVLDEINFTPAGIAGCFALYAPAGSSLRYVFFNEFICVSRLTRSPLSVPLFTFRSDFHPWHGHLGLRRPHQFLRPHLFPVCSYRPWLCHDHLGFRSRWSRCQYGS